MDTEPTRVSIKRVRPNPLFQDWLEELHEESIQKNSKLEPMLRVAKQSLSKYPLPLNSGKECAILEGFKKQLCDFIDLRLEVYIHNLSVQVDKDKDPECQQNENNLQIVKSIKHASNNDIVKNYTSTVTSMRTKLPTVISTDLVSQSQGVDLTGAGSMLNTKNREPVESGGGTSTNQLNTHLGPPVALHPLNNYSGSPFVPFFQFGVYALLQVLLEHVDKNPDNPYMHEKELIDNAQKYCSECSGLSFRDEILFLTIKRYLIWKGNKKVLYYCLTKEGLFYAQVILKKFIKVSEHVFDALETGQYFDIDNNNIDNLSQTSEIVKLPANSFDVVLLIDTKETIGMNKGNAGLERISQQFPNTKCEHRSLKVGDYMWIARHKINTDQELVLPYIIERKRMNDLASSIKDGRFHEQKFRLEKCGLSNVIYLIEKCGNNKYVGLPLQTLRQAIVNTRVQDKFKIHVTESVDDTLTFLALMTERLTISYEGKDLQGADCYSKDDLMTFKFFNSASSKRKPLTVSETFIKMLLQLKGLSVVKTLAVVNEYKTPKKLIEAYKNCEEKERPELLAKLKFDETSGPSVGSKISNSVHYLFGPSKQKASNIT